MTGNSKGQNKDHITSQIARRLLVLPKEGSHMMIDMDTLEIIQLIIRCFWHPKIIHMHGSKATKTLISAHMVKRSLNIKSLKLLQELRWH